MLLFPVAGADLDGVAGIQAIDSKGLELVLGRLIGAQKPLDISLNGQTDCFGSFLEPLLKLRINRYCHRSSRPYSSTPRFYAIFPFVSGEPDVAYVGEPPHLPTRR